MTTYTCDLCKTPVDEAQLVRVALEAMRGKVGLPGLKADLCQKCWVALSYDLRKRLRP